MGKIYSMVSLFFTLCLLPLLTQAVTVTLSLAGNHPNPLMAGFATQVCNNLRPGRCCQGRPPMLTLIGQQPGPEHLSPNYRVAQWVGLQVLDIAAVWQPQGTKVGCSGTPLDTTTGPGSWRYPAEGDSNTMITGASYIKLPLKFPTNEEAPFLEAEGILGLITGGGKWVTKQAGSSLLQEAAKAALLGFGGSRTRRRRGIISKDEGYVLAQPPGENVWADLIVINGTEYKEESAGSPIYTSQGGLVLNFTDGAP